MSHKRSDCRRLGAQVQTAGGSGHQRILRPGSCGDRCGNCRRFRRFFRRRRRRNGGRYSRFIGRSDCRLDRRHRRGGHCRRDRAFLKRQENSHHIAGASAVADLTPAVAHRKHVDHRIARNHRQNGTAALALHAHIQTAGDGRHPGLANNCGIPRRFRGRFQADSGRGQIAHAAFPADLPPFPCLGIDCQRVAEGQQHHGCGVFRRFLPQVDQLAGHSGGNAGGPRRGGRAFGGRRTFRRRGRFRGRRGVFRGLCVLLIAKEGAHHIPFQPVPLDAAPGAVVAEHRHPASHRQLGNGRTDRRGRRPQIHRSRAALGGHNGHATATGAALARIDRRQGRDKVAVDVGRDAHILHIGPVPRKGEHGQHRAGRGRAQLFRAQAGLPTEVHIIVGRDRHEALHRGGCFFRTLGGAGNDQIFRGHVALQAAIAHKAPAAVIRQHLHDGAVAQRADQRRGIRLAAAQDQRTAGHQLHRALAGRAVLRQVGGIPDGGLLLAGGGAENGAGKAFLYPLAALVIETQNFIVGIAQLAHVHGAALAHTHAVAVAPGLQAEPGGRLLHAPKFVFGGLDAHAQHAFQLGENIAGYGNGLQTAAGGSGGQLKVHLRIQAAGRLVFGRMGRDALQRDKRHALPQLAFRLALQKGYQPRRVGRMGQILVYSLFLHGRTGVGIVKGVVLDGKVGICPAAHAVGCGFGLSAVAGGIIGHNVLATVLKHDTPGGVNGGDAVGVARGRAPVDLIAGGIHHVVAAGGPAAHHPHGVGAGGHRLCLQRLYIAGVTHFIGNHAVEIVLDVDMGDDIELVASAGLLHCLKGQVSGIGIAAFPGLRDHDSVHAGGAVAAQGKIAAHVYHHAILGQRQLAGGAVEADGQACPAGKRAGQIAAQTVAARHGHIQPGGAAQRGQPDPHHAIQGRRLGGQSGGLNRHASHVRRHCGKSAHQQTESRKKGGDLLQCRVLSHESCLRS